MDDNSNNDNVNDTVNDNVNDNIEIGNGDEPTRNVEIAPDAVIDCGVELPTLAPRRSDSAIRRRIVRFCVLVAVIIGTYAVVGGVGLFLYSAYAGGGENGLLIGFNNMNDAKSGGGSDINGVVSAAQPTDDESAPTRTTVLVLGVNDGLADTIFCVTFSSGDNMIDIVSIPRDTKIKLPKEDVDRLHALGRRNTPNSGVMKINELHSYSGSEYGPEEERTFIQNWLGIKIDYYVVVSLKAFRDIVDMVDGIWIDVPHKLDYDDKDATPPLHIHLEKGYQLLDGEHAEQFVRFRKGNKDSAYAGYPEGDTGRVDMQQLFIQEFMRQALTQEKIRNNAIGFASTIVSYVKTDIGLDDIPKYAPLIKETSADSLTSHTIPGYGDYEGSVSYYFVDEAATAAMIDEIFFAQPTVSSTSRSIPSESEQANVITDYSINIEVLNGTGVGGLAATVRDKLNAAGYTVGEIGTYDASQKAETRIIVRDAKSAGQLVRYFKNAIVTTDGQLPAGFDVVIIVGTSESQ